jgi:type III pantothenate kinase
MLELVSFDFIDESDKYLGGAILGLQLRYKSLHDFTAKLPLLSLEVKGVGTQQKSIHSGVVNGLVYEIDGFIDEYRAICSNFIIILTGGDTEFWLND